MLLMKLPAVKICFPSWIKILFFIWVVPQTIQAQSDEKFDYLNKNPVLVAEESTAKSFFADEEILQFNLSLNYPELLKDRGEERGYHPAVVSYKDPNGNPVAVEAKVMVRGNNRRNPAVCRFPPLMLNFSRKTTANTIFQPVNKLKLVTHCNADEYILREYMVYKVYNLLTNYSFRVRLCRINYIDTQSKRKTESKYAYLMEDDKELAKRNQAELLPKEYFITMDKTDSIAMAKVALFQYMVGNTDWSVPYRHNIKLLQVATAGAPVPVPYDFDYTGLVEAPYATPPPELGINSVRQRLFRGYHFSNAIYEPVIKDFNAQKEKIYALYQQSSLLNKGYCKQTLNFLDSFYKTINSPKNFQNSIVRVGKQNQKKYVVIKGLNSSF